MVVVVGAEAEVGRTGATSAEEVVDVVEWVDDGDLVGPSLVTVEMTEVTAVDVDVAVVGSVEADCRGPATIVFEVERVDGEAVTTGWTVVVTVESATPKSMLISTRQRRVFGQECNDLQPAPLQV